MTMYYDETIGYQWIKDAAKQRGVPVGDLIALAPQNDPFYTGTPNDQALGQWFADLWYAFGLDRAHIRRVHYQIVSQDPPVLLPNGKPYENTVECWDLLNLASKAARYLQLVDPANFNDRRTPEVQLYAPESPRYRSRVGAYVRNPAAYRGEMELPEFPELPTYQTGGYEPHQRYHLEVWCEKSTMNDVLAPLCQRFSANLQTGAGEMSITATLSLVRRLQQAERPARILYVSDFDPAGQSMPVAVSRKIEYFTRTLGFDLDVRLFPVVLTLDQVQQYRLPRTPIKETERRRVGFEARHGEGAVELDALEALYPGELERVVSQHLAAYYDETLSDRVRQMQDALQADLSARWQAIMGQYAGDVAALREDYAQLQRDLGGRLAAFRDQVRGLWQVMQRDLGEQATGLVQQYPLPEPDWGMELGEGLYNSRRDYFEQIEAYKQFQGRG